MSKNESLQTWEDSEFPILCETCLGENPYVRMTKERFGKECKVCAKPFTVFRWLPGRGMRYKKTEICQSCAKLKNVCQTCILDLEHGLPVQVRDSALGLEDAAPRDDINRRHYMENQARTDTPLDFSGRANPAGREMLKRMARRGPYYERNKPHLCSFFAKGTCTRGNECPYRHELPKADGELAKQNIIDRYHGTNDPVAKRMLARSSAKVDGLAPPDDKSIASLFLVGLTAETSADDIKGYFYAYGEVKSVNVVPAKGCAFVNFKTRAGAEAAAQAVIGGCVIGGKSIRVAWGRARPKGPRADAPKPTTAGAPPPPPGSTRAMAYPSQDPTAQGAQPK
ncbi:Pre-mRNA-splicing factor RBM22 [Linderina pennispora]|uniref:Pre-mRNA-splicing factor SLT11 n=1 Tax=Linderina pennispora TaxID=61395 RepID=A0A1Y1W0N6_9FUNG|nr:Pre-mRNA-splicing factor RBM22 [Linderina pennispora]ORX67070.1 Pre-mRNA-splicing factor RBM22 [Linderina pennispora]